MPKIPPEVFAVAGEEMGSLGGDRRLEDGDVFLGELDFIRKRDAAFRNYVELSDELVKPLELVFRGEVPAGF